MSLRNHVLLLPLIGLFVFAASTVPGCRQEQSKKTGKSSASGTLLVGLVPEESMFKQIERYDPLARYLSERTGLDVKLTILPRYENILAGFPSQKMDAAFFGSMTYVLARRQLDIEAIVRPVRADGSSTYHGMIFVRKDSGIRSIRDMRGKRFAFVSRDTIAGYVLPLVYFNKAGIQYKSYLREAYFTGTHEDAIRDVLDRKADVGAAKNTEFERLAQADPRIREELRVLALSPEMPENSLAVRKDLDPAVRSVLKQALLTMDLDPSGNAVLRQFGAEKFIECREEDYDPVVKYLRTAGIGIETGMGRLP